MRQIRRWGRPPKRPAKRRRGRRADFRRVSGQSRNSPRAPCSSVRAVRVPVPVAGAAAAQVSEACRRGCQAYVCRGNPGGRGRWNIEGRHGRGVARDGSAWYARRRTWRGRRTTTRKRAQGQQGAAASPERNRHRRRGRSRCAGHWSGPGPRPRSGSTTRRGRGDARPGPVPRAIGPATRARVTGRAGTPSASAVAANR